MLVFKFLNSESRLNSNFLDIFGKFQNLTDHGRCFPSLFKQMQKFFWDQKTTHFIYWNGFTCISMADTCNNFSKSGKGFETGTNEAYNMKITIRIWSILKIFCFCSYANMAASDKCISLKRKILEKVLLNFNN